MVFQAADGDDRFLRNCQSVHDAAVFRYAGCDRNITLCVFEHPPDRVDRCRRVVPVHAIPPSKRGTIPPPNDVGMVLFDLHVLSFLDASSRRVRLRALVSSTREGASPLQSDYPKRAQGYEQAEEREKPEYGGVVHFPSAQRVECWV